MAKQKVHRTSGARHNGAGQSAGNHRRRFRRQRRSWPWVGGTLVLVILIVGLFVYLAHQQDTAAQVGKDTVLSSITSLDPSLFAAISKGSANAQPYPLTGVSPLTGISGKPIVLYVGGDFCPYCAAQRWALILALSRFGSFGHLDPLVSSEGNVPTFTFHQADPYTSAYLQLDATEVSDNQGQVLDSLDPDLQQVFNTYNRPPYVGSTGSIPFLDVGNRFISVGSYFPPDLLVGHSYQDIATQLHDPSSEIAQGVVGAANLLTAEVCIVTTNQPATVCTAPPLPELQASFQQSSRTEGTVPHPTQAAWFERSVWTRETYAYFQQ